MANTVALAKQDQERADPPALSQGDPTPGTTIEHPITPGAGSGPCLWTVYEDYFATGE